jgi:hypothetical protein
MHSLNRNVLLSLAVFLSLSGLRSAADEYPVPPDSGWTVVSRHGVKADGATDNTRALRNLPFPSKDAMGTMFFPNGTYVVSDTVMVGMDQFKSANKRLTLQGESRNRTIIRLADNSPGFDNPAKPKAVISFHKSSGSSGQAFGNSVFNLTVDVGRGNPGAIAIAYTNNNHGCIRNVKLLAPEGSGFAGLGLTYNWPGPGFVQDLEIDGFDYGIYSTIGQYSMVFENLWLRNQRKAGVKNSRQMLRFRNVISENRVPAFDLADSGNVTILNAKLNGGAPGTAAIVGTPDLYLQNVSAAGYDEVIDGQGNTVAQHASRGIADFGGGLQQPLMLEPKSTPDIDPGPVSEWVYVNGFRGATLQEKFQNAIDSGARTLYFNEDELLKVDDTIFIRGNVECIMGMGASNRGGKTFKGSDKPVFKIEDGNGRPLLIDRLPDSYGAQNWMFEIATSRTVVFCNMAVGGMRNTVPGGTVFLEDIVGQRPTNFEFTGNTVYARQWNPESLNGTNIVLRNTTAWIFGLKSEYGHTLLDLDDGARAEVYGVFSYHTGKAPLFRIGKGTITATNLSLSERGFETWFAIDGENKGRNPGTLLTGSSNSSGRHRLP